MAKKDKILKKAQKFIHKGSYDKAVVEYKSLIDMDSGDVSVRLRLGDLYVKTGQLEEAVKEYTSAAKSNARRGFYLKAIAVYKRVLTIEKNSTDTHYKLAELYTKQRLIADAMSQYTIILNHFEQKGLDSEELDILQKMVQLDPTNLSIKLKLADMYRKLDFIDDAFGMYRLVCGKLFEAGNYKKAEDIYQELYGHYPEEPRVLKGLVDVYREKGDDDELLTYASLLLQHHVQSGELDEGLEVSKKILDLRPDDAESLSFLESYGPEELTDDHHGPDVDMEEEEVVEPASVVTHDDLMVSEPEAEAEEEEVLEEEAAEEEEELEISLEGFEDGVSEVTEGAEAEESRETGEIEETIESGEEEYVSLDIPGLDGDVLDKEPLPPGNATPLYGHEERLVDEEEPPTLEDKGEGAFPSEADVSEGEPHDEVEASREEEAAGELDSDEESGEIESIDVLAESFLEEERTSDDIAQIDSEAETEIEADIDFIEEGFGDEDEQPDDGGSDAQSALEHDLGEEPQPTEGSGNEEDAEQEGSLDEEFFEGLDGDGEPALEAEAGEEQEAVEALDTSLEEEAAEDGESSPLEELLEEEPSEDHEPDDVPQSFDEDRGESEVVELISATAEEETLLEEETTAPELE
ncbi:MAG: tetratricopeptide repeat protein, partial [Thermodesulfobacteriota bacterium]